MCTLRLGQFLMSQLPCRCRVPASLSTSPSWTPAGTSRLVWLLFPYLSHQRCSTYLQVPPSLLLVPELDGQLPLSLTRTPHTTCLQVPSGLLPVLEMDGQLTTESAAIMDKLEAAFPQHPMTPWPEGSPEDRRARQLLALERRLFGAWLQWLCQAWWVGRVVVDTADLMAAVHG